MEDICSGTFEKVFLPIENNEVDFSNEMVNFKLSRGEAFSIFLCTRRVTSDK